MIVMTLCNAVPANPEDRTHIEDLNGDLVCFVEHGGNNHHQDFDSAKRIAMILNNSDCDNLKDAIAIFLKTKHNSGMIKSIRHLESDLVNYDAN